MPNSPDNLIVSAITGADTTISASATIRAGATARRANPMNHGATGDGSSDDTAAISSAIAALTAGGILTLPCGTYVVSSQLFINVSNVTVNGSGCATIISASPGAVMVIGGPGTGNPSYGPAVALVSAANELSTSFTTVSSLGASAGDFILFQEGGEDSSQGSGNAGCDISGCRGELVEVASVSGNTITVTTALHDIYDPAVNDATAQLMIGPLSGVTIENITLNGNGTSTYGLAMAGVVNSSVSGVKVENVQGSALLNRGDFNVAWSNITVTGAGSEECGASAWFQAQGNLSINGLSISNENQGDPYSAASVTELSVSR